MKSAGLPGFFEAATGELFALLVAPAGLSLSDAGGLARQEGALAGASGAEPGPSGPHLPDVGDWTWDG
ncbi:hypothetical protein AV521_19790 [Streptomyces sp. IMTB 2501]|uniref:hypothetical protein n=1 Tax=Streptomyces sp. IMTB 2501 TaxID=1776340 RepID=UPI00096D1421|nr:hypothetical protein [Streptomyces sp. IMTB 2501]OLZ68999.1 hypothetical protein AV521_19790 [Streptomyces sp. IMTB 2501]